MPDTGMISSLGLPHEIFTSDTVQAMVKSSNRTATVAPIAGIMSLQVIVLELVTLKSSVLRF
jgi:hypothetical protein